MTSLGNLLTTIEQRLPLLHDIVYRFWGMAPLRGQRVLAIQHQLGDAPYQIAALLELGLDPADLFWIDIPYTSFREVRDTVRRLGVPERNFTVHDYRLGQPYSDYQVARVASWIDDHVGAEADPGRLVVLDDGAYFLKAAVSRRGAELEGKVAIVEQTQRGTNFVRDCDNLGSLLDGIPLVNVAESSPKKTIEPPLIAHAVSEALSESAADRLRRESGWNCLVLGYGSIGTSVVEELPEHFPLTRDRIFVHDPDAGREDSARASGVQLWDPEDGDVRFRLVIGCAGERSFPPGHHRYLEDGAFLASATSGSIELAINQLFEHQRHGSDADYRILDEAELRAGSIHADVKVQFGESLATYLNGGFPINFDGQRTDRIPLERIQLTAAMMVSGAVQAALSEGGGIEELDPEVCGTLSSRFTALDA